MLNSSKTETLLCHDHRTACSRRVLWDYSGFVEQQQERPCFSVITGRPDRWELCEITRALLNSNKTEILLCHDHRAAWSRRVVWDYSGFQFPHYFHAIKKRLDTKELTSAKINSESITLSLHYMLMDVVVFIELQEHVCATW